MAKGKERLDLLLVRQGLAASREKAKSLIMSGVVYAKGFRLEKPGMELDENTLLEIKGEQQAYVSRGGLKLAKAIEVFRLNFHGQVVADIGASTGGFTDCVLRNGAARVYAIDVGYGQLDWKLRTDQRVISMERTNARYLKETSLPEKVDWIISDVAFISIIKILPAMCAILKEKGQIILLIKPQFEAGREKVGKKGVVKDPAVHCQVLHNVLEEAQKNGFEIKGLDFSPIQGPEGNIEFLAWLSRPGLKDESVFKMIENIVAKAQREIKA
ncbi:MAG TPA: TlyA family RNA methyltransferase [Desulfitobacteriaceae bacterium]|nr:TlyA family RNA methyltransferase [Desulfitobacteriaceae bacterium]